MRKFTDPFALLVAQQRPGGKEKVAASTNPRIVAARGQLDQIDAAEKAGAPARAAAEAANVQRQAETKAQFDRQVAASNEERRKRPNSLLGGFGGGFLGGRSLLGGR